MGGLLFVLFISIVIPVTIFIYAIVKRNLLTFMYGVFAFVISQLLIRLPILQLLELNSFTFSMFRATKPILFAIFLGLSAGIVEEFARFLFMRYLLKEQSWRNGILFGAGHGGIEAIIFVGINALVMLFTVQVGMSGIEYFISGIERLLAILLHIGLTLLVLRTVVEKRIRYLCIAIIIHGFVNSTAGILPNYLKHTTAIVVIEIILAVTVFILWAYLFYKKRKDVFT